MTMTRKIMRCACAVAAALQLLSVWAGDVKLENYQTQSPAVDTLRIELFDTEGHKQGFWTELSFWSSDFYSHGDERSVNVLGDGHPDLTYMVWLQKDPSTLVVILPGFSGNYLSSSNIALAEVFFKKGYSALVVSSAMNWEFMEGAATAKVPGYTPQDAVDIYNALQAVFADIEKRSPGKMTKKILAGMSLGALHTLFISEIDGREKKIGFERYLAINPPVDLMHALGMIDSYHLTWEKWRVDQIQRKVDMAVASYLKLMELKPAANRKADPESPTPLPTFAVPTLPIGEEEARELIGFNFQLRLLEIIYSINKRHDFGLIRTKCGWFQRRDLYNEMDRFTFRVYINTFIKKYYSEKLGRPVDIEQLNREASLPAIEASLAADKKVRVFHNADDFLLTDTHREWLKKTLGPRLTLFDHGGHLGNLYLREVQELMIKAVEE